MAIYTAIFAGAISAFVFVFFSVPLCVFLAKRIGLIDLPQGRKQHTEETPLVGGLAIFIGYSMALVVMGEIYLWRLPLFCAWLVLIALGIWDDLGHVKVTVRVTVQILVIILLCLFSGMQLEHLGYLYGDEPVMLGGFALPITVLGLIGIKNSINLIDGLDGLASTQILVALSWFAILSYQNEIVLIVALCAPLAGAVLGFLMYNLRLFKRLPRIFLGDHGSVFLGFTVGWYAIVGSQLSIPAFTPIEAVWILGLPVLDTIRVMLSRMLRGISPFTPGRDHLHHLLLEYGWSSNTVLMVLFLVSLLFGGIAWMGRLLNLSEMTLFFGFLLLSLGFFVGVQSLSRRLHSFVRCGSNRGNSKL